MHAQIPHSFTKAEAIARIKKGITEARSQFSQHAESIEERWEDHILRFAFQLQGKKIEGTLEVRENEFVLDATLPLMWRMFEGKIERMIKEQSEQLLR